MWAVRGWPTCNPTTLILTPWETPNKLNATSETWTSLNHGIVDYIKALDIIRRHNNIGKQYWFLCLWKRMSRIFYQNCHTLHGSCNILQELSTKCFWFSGTKHYTCLRALHFYNVLTLKFWINLNLHVTSHVETTFLSTLSKTNMTQVLYLDNYMGI